MKRANELKLNIGLENNTKLVTEILQHIKYAGFYIDNEFNYRVDLSEYKNEVEQTLIIEGLTSQGLVYCVDMVQRFCSLLNQECIAAKIDNNELLIYAINYKGEKQKFNNDYFINFSK